MVWISAMGQIGPASVGGRPFLGFAGETLVTVSDLIHTDPDGFFSKEKLTVRFSPFQDCLCTSKVSGRSWCNWMIQGESFSESFRWNCLNHECNGRDIVPRQGWALKCELPAAGVRVWVPAPDTVHICTCVCRHAHGMKFSSSAWLKKT